MDDRVTTLILRAYAKVNLTLEVMDRRSDGFHSIKSVMQAISLHDSIELSIGDEPGIRVTCSAPEIPTDERNLVWKAAALLLDNCNISSGVDIHIDKRIPHEAGLGGGSSDAAAVLNGLNSLLHLNMSRAELGSLGSQIGSDIPFFIAGGTAYVEGRGEEIRTLPNLQEWWLAVVKPPFGVSTPWAYRRLDEIRDSGDFAQTSSTSSEDLIAHIVRDGGADLPRFLSNDLELPATEMHPEIAEIKHELIDSSAVGAMMCGSGSAVFGLFRAEEAALCAAERLAGRGVTFVARTVGRF